MRSPSRPPESNQLITFVVLMLLGLALWAVAAYVWYQAYIWFSWVTWPTSVLTLAVFPVPFLAYSRFTGSSGLPMERHARLGEAGPHGPTATSFVGDWLVWLGNGEAHRGTLVIFIFVFWSLLYWSLEPFTTLTFSAWGLLTVIGILILRFFFRPSREVSAAGETKSRPK